MDGMRREYDALKYSSIRYSAADTGKIKKREFNVSSSDASSLTFYIQNDHDRNELRTSSI